MQVSQEVSALFFLYLQIKQNKCFVLGQKIANLIDRGRCTSDLSGQNTFMFICLKTSQFAGLDFSMIKITKTALK